MLLDISTGQVILRVAIAVALGAVIGFEREIDAQPAGFRTHILLATGAMLFGMISAYAFDPFEVTNRNDTNVSIDVTRVASQVVVGVGFLGGGAILKYGASVLGLTTAASMWVTASVGLAVGLGFYWGAVAVTVAVLFTLVGLRFVRNWIRARIGRQVEVATFRLEAGTDPADLLEEIERTPRVSVRSLRIDRDPETGRSEVTARLKSDAGVQLAPVLSRLARRNDVDSLDLEDLN
jgi:putative Mg2+ transporter-C (MgtC) family protein